MLLSVIFSLCHIVSGVLLFVCLAWKSRDRGVEKGFSVELAQPHSFHRFKRHGKSTTSLNTRTIIQQVTTPTEL